MIYLSLLSLLVSLKFLVGKIVSLWGRVFVTVLFLLSLFMIVVYLISDYLTGSGFDESVIFHLKTGLGGAALGEFAGVIAAGIASILLLVVMLIFLIRKLKAPQDQNVGWRYLFMGSMTLLLSLMANPIVDDLQTLYFIKADTSFYWHYRNPVISEVPKKKKNLVYLYAESYERTYFDEDLFPGLAPELKVLEKKALSFTDLYQVQGTGWTIAGMTASQCGIPLVSPSGGNSMGGIEGPFLPGAVCLGDLLKKEGYRLEYYGGSSLKFAGKGNFYKSHSFDKVMGREELRPLMRDPDYMTGWGLYDDTLLEIVYSEYERLARKGEPFALFALTLDTHHPKGHMSRSCIEEGIRYGDGSNEMLNALQCSDRLISRFVKKIMASDGAEDTLIVVASDHLSHRNRVYDRLNRGKRRDLFMVIDPSGKIAAGRVEKKGMTLDIGPTLLDLMGMPGELGLGRDLLKEKSLIEDRNLADILREENPEKMRKMDNATLTGLNVSNMNHRLALWRADTMQLWKFPDIEEGFIVDGKRRTVQLGNRKLRVPVLLEVFSDMKVKPYFCKDSKGRLEDLMSNFGIDSRFLWIDRCAYMQNPVVVSEGNNSGLCLGVGSYLGESLEVFPVGDELNWTADDVKTMFKEPETMGFERNITWYVPTSRYRYPQRMHPGENPSFAKILQRYGGNRYLIFMSAYATEERLFSPEFKAFMHKNSRLFFKRNPDELFYAVIHGGKILKEELGCSGPIKWSEEFGRFHVDLSVNGLTTLYGSSVRINGLELSPNRYGINLVILDTETGAVDTYSFFDPDQAM